MKYYAVINKPVRNMRVYNVLKSVTNQTNAASMLFQKLVDRFFVKGKQAK